MAKVAFNSTGAVRFYEMYTGLMYDDMYSDKEPVIERALELLPEDIATARYRRIMRATHLNHIRLYLPPHGRATFRSCVCVKHASPERRVEGGLGKQYCSSE